MNYSWLIQDLRLSDAIDILLLTTLVYHLFIWFQGTKAMKALVGLFALAIVYAAARISGLFLTTWVFQLFWQVLVILLIILFQSEIRQVLERINPLQFLGLHGPSMKEDWIPGFVQAIFSMAERRIGALLILERKDRVREWVTAGFPLDAEPSPEFLVSLFQKDSLLHDGAVMIRGGRLVLTACYLPLSSAEGLPKKWGTRHRAALGLSERCDCWVVAVSEERGEVSLARAGRMIRLDTPEDLAIMLLEAVSPARAQRTTWYAKIASLVVGRWPLKLGTLAIVSTVWLLVAGQQDFQVDLRIPVGFKGLPSQLEIVEPLKSEVNIKIRGLRKDAGTLSERNVHAVVDLSSAHPGVQTYRITLNQVTLPHERLLRIVDIEPSWVDVTVRKKM